MVLFLSHFPTPSLDCFIGIKTNPDTLPRPRGLAASGPDPLGADCPSSASAESHAYHAVYRAVGIDVLKRGRPSAVFSLGRNLCFWLAATVKRV